MTVDRAQKIRTALETTLAPESLEVDDESHLHVGHVGARDGRGHFRVTIVANAFRGLGRIQRHRLIYEALGTMMASDIHALSIDASFPGER